MNDSYIVLDMCRVQERGELVSVLRGVARTSWEESNASLGHMKNVAAQFTGMVSALESMLNTRVGGGIMLYSM